MVAAIIILSVLLIGSIAFIFWLFKVLKNTCEIINFSLNTLMGEMPEAYDGKYYPCTLFLDVTRGSPHERIYDFSLYESHNVIGVKLIIDEDDEELYGTKIIPRAIVYQAMEGCWMWKPSS